MPLYTLEVRPDAPVFLITPLPGQSVAAGIESGMPDVVALLDNASEPMFAILDLRGVSMDLDELMRAASLSARGRDPIMHHRMLRESIFIATNSFMKMAIKGLTSATFGQARLATFETPDEALDYCYEKLGRSRGASEDDIQAKAG